MLFCSHRESLLLSLPCYSPRSTALHKYRSDRRSLCCRHCRSKQISTSRKRGRLLINAVLPKTECIAGKFFFVPSCMLWNTRMKRSLLLTANLMSALGNVFLVREENCVTLCDLRFPSSLAQALGFLSHLL